ncbi:hypothetical protein [Sporomusa sp.]|uniref:hypothetical protein n=1 Tax=Sporomusa sp. TaxID=2078658 RepID=UPI002C333E11|nr:hypothetical protein [Sporomusa sp.]HWR44260.1 hypothetical protein [Sporomusa sp.]
MANTTCYDRHCDYEHKEGKEVLLWNDYILIAGIATLAVLLMAAVLLNNIFRMSRACTQ